MQLNVMNAGSSACWPIRPTAALGAGRRPALPGPRHQRGQPARRHAVGARLSSDRGSPISRTRVARSSRRASGSTRCGSSTHRSGGSSTSAGSTPASSRAAPSAPGTPSANSPPEGSAEGGFRGCRGRQLGQQLPVPWPGRSTAPRPGGCGPNRIQREPLDLAGAPAAAPPTPTADPTPAGGAGPRSAHRCRH